MPDYIDEEEIGSGGFATVWRCRLPFDGISYAKKFLTREDSPSDVSRFRREVQILKSLDHPNIVRVIAPSLEKPPYYFVMPFYAHSLDDVLDGVIGNDSRISAIFSRILNGVQYAHQKGVIHRDLKPRNILLNGDEDVVVSDFGLGRVIDSNSTRNTLSGDLLGTFFYMAPEQFHNAKDATELSDIYSLGRILGELHTDRIRSPLLNFSGMPVEIRVIAERCTQHDPRRRYQSVAELRAAWIAVANTRVSPSLQEALEAAIMGTDKERPTEKVLLTLLNALCAVRTNTNVLHDAVMTLNVDLILRLKSLDDGVTRDMLQRFIDHSCSIRWPERRADIIAKMLFGLHRRINDLALEASITKGLFLLGFNNNRFSILSLFRTIVFEAQKPAAINAIINELRSLDETQQKFVARHLSKRRVHPAIAAVLTNFKSSKP